MILIRAILLYRSVSFILLVFDLQWTFLKEVGQILNRTELPGCDCGLLLLLLFGVERLGMTKLVDDYQD